MESQPSSLNPSQARSKADSDPGSGNTSPAKLLLKEAAEHQIDEFMKKVGYRNPSARTDDHGWRWFEFASAKGRAGVVQSESDGEMYFHAESLVMELPSESDGILPLMRELLEANMTIAGPARLGISGEGVFVSATIPLSELTPDGVPAHIHSVMVIADSFGQPNAEGPSYEGATQPGIATQPAPDPNLRAG